MESIERVLREHPFLRDLTQFQVHFILGCAGNARFAEGEYLIREGGEATDLYLIRSGRVALEIDVPARGVVELETLEPGDILGVSWLTPPYRWSLDARAVTPVLAIGLNAACLRGKMEEDPIFGYALSKRLLLHLSQRLTRVRLQRVDLYRAEP
ncbi:MAG TPA: cyclic nucleotide-binding domain-containing protein [Polyangia bacterium]|jgi:CRP-like cAMP-binding protein